MSTTPFKSAAEAGIEIGKADRLTQERTAKLAEIYKKANAEKREQMRAEFMLAYVMGRLNINEQEAETVLKTSRKKRADGEQKAYACGTNQFAHHIIRDTLREEKEGGESNKNKSTDKVALCIKYITKQELTKAQLKKLIAQLTA